MTGKTEENDMGRKKQISDQKRLHRERMRLQKGVFSSLATSVPELHQWLRACKRENARKKSQGHNGTKKQAKDLHI